MTLFDDHGEKIRIRRKIIERKKTNEKNGTIRTA